MRPPVLLNCASAVKLSLLALLRHDRTLLAYSSVRIDRVTKQLPVVGC